MQASAILALSSSALFAADVALIEPGKPAAKIYVSADESKPVEVLVKKNPVLQPNPLTNAVEDLAYHLEKMTGVKPEIVQETDKSKIPSSALVVGRLARELGAEPGKTDWQESYRLLAKDGRVLIAGERPEATVYGIYAFLNQLGCNWVMPGKLGEVIPQKPSLKIGTLDISSQPDFALRWMWIGGGPKYISPEQAAEFEQWKIRQRMGYAWEYRRRVAEAHMWQAVVAKYKEEFAKNPEMLALVRRPDGTFVRQGPQIESTNPQLIDLVVRFIREKFAQEGWPKDEKVTVAVGPADGLDFSESPESLAAGANRIDPIIGSFDTTDLVVKLANDVLDKIGAEFPNLSLGYYIYSTHEDFPARYNPNPRIYPIFAPINYSRFHSTVDPHSKTRAFYKTIADQWGDLAKKQGNLLMVYEYNWNLADNMLPFTRIRMIAEDLQYYHRLGVMGVTVQAIKAWAVNAPHDFIYARMIWDTSLDWKNVLREYCRLSFGDAAEIMERYYLRLADIQQTSGQEAGSYFSAPLIFDDAFMKASRADIDAALAQKNLTADQRARLEGAALGFQILEDYLAWNKAMTLFEFASAVELGNAMQATYDKTLAANPHFTGREAGIYIQRLLMNSTREAAKFSTAPYRIIEKLPDELPTMFDPGSNGDRMNLFGNEINYSGWVKTKTYSSTWDAQGLALLRQGSVWYRTDFNVPADLKSQGIGLLLSAFEDEARIWLNGKYIGTSGIKYPTPASFDLTDAVKFGEKNRLTIQVKRNSMANEVGLGGILRPGFVFAGPRLVTEQKQDDVRRRVLPGGDVEEIKTSDEKKNTSAPKKP